MEPLPSTMQTTPRLIERSNTSSLVELVGIQSRNIESVWPSVSSFIDRAIQHCDGKYTKENVKQSLLNRDMQLWLAMSEHIEAVLVTEIISYPAKKVCTFVFLAGEDFQRWSGLLHQIEQWAKSQGCESIELFGRPGWQKVLDWERIHIVLRKKIK